MKRLLAVVFVIVTSDNFAAEPAKPNSLTPKEIADGWLLLSHDNDSFGWKTLGDAVEQVVLVRDSV